MALVFGTRGAVDAALNTAPGGVVDLGASGVSRVSLTGTDTVSSFGGGANKHCMVLFESATPLESTDSLQLLDGGRTTVEGAVGFYSSDDAGKWTELAYSTPDPQLVAPTGTAMLFVQSSAPVGWTKSTAHNDKALRVVSGTAGSGGATAFSSVFGAGRLTGSTILSSTQVPSIVTDVSGDLASGNLDAAAVSPADSSYNFGTLVGSSSSVGAASAGHTHTLNLDVTFVDVIIATRD